MDTETYLQLLPPELFRSLDSSESARLTGSARRRRCERKQRRGKRSGLRARLKLNPHRQSLPSIFLANVRSLANKVDELRLRITQQKFMNCNVMVFTETWLNNTIPASAIELQGRNIFRADRTVTGSGKSKGGGVCIYVNRAWCTDAVIIESHCSADIEYLFIKCRPFYLPREFSSTIITAVDVPPDATAKLAMKDLCSAVNKMQTVYPDGAFIIAGDFNHANLRSVLPKFYQNVSCPTRGANTLDNVYTNISDAYKAVPQPHVGQSDHLSLFLLPKYIPVIKRVKPAVKTVKVWLITMGFFVVTMVFL